MPVYLLYISYLFKSHLGILYVCGKLNNHLMLPLHDYTPMVVS